MRPVPTGVDSVLLLGGFDGGEDSVPGVLRGGDFDGQASFFRCGGCDRADRRDAGLIADRFWQQGGEAAGDGGAAEGDPVELTVIEQPSSLLGEFLGIHMPVSDRCVERNARSLKRFGDDLSPTIGSCPENRAFGAGRDEGFGQSFRAVGLGNQVGFQMKCFQSLCCRGADAGDFGRTETAGIAAELPGSLKEVFDSVGGGEDQPVVRGRLLDRRIEFVAVFWRGDFEHRHEDGIGSAGDGCLDLRLGLGNRASDADSLSEERLQLEPFDTIPHLYAFANDNQ